MEWAALYTKDQQPGWEQIDQYIANPLWQELNAYLQQAYAAQPQLQHSGCSMQQGWNIKYHKGGKALCTLYPMPGYFIALVVIGAREMGEAALLLPGCAAYTQQLYARTPVSMNQKWLMIEVKSREVLEDVQALIALRRAPQAAAAAK